jgi:hypothetical protein
MLARLLEGLQSMHDDGERRAFLLEMGARLNEFSAWLTEAGLAEMVDVERPPTFLHGGLSRGRWIVMGINPGADKHQKEHHFKRRSPNDYLAFHEQFFEHFPRLRPNGKQPWWTKLYRVMLALREGKDPGPTNVAWDRLQKDPSFVAQDLIPFHGARSGTLPREFELGTTLCAISQATLEGIARSQARGILVFSRQGYQVFRRNPNVVLTRDFSLDGETRVYEFPRRIDAYVGRIGNIPVVALDNEFIAQPMFSYEQALPRLIEELRNESLV